MRKIGLIGAGLIGGPVIEVFERVELDGYELTSVLVQRPRRHILGLYTTDRDEFLATEPDIIVEAAGGSAIREHGLASLEVADLWVMSVAALADRDLHQQLTAAAVAHGRELRILTGAIAGLDAVATAAVDPNMRLSLQICIGATDRPRETVFRGTVDEAARRYPEDVNVAVAAALAGHGPEKTAIEVVRPGPGESRELRLTASSIYGTIETVSVPGVDPNAGIHVCAANILATLRMEHARRSQPSEIASRS